MRTRDDKKIEAIVQATISLVNEIGLAEASVAKISKKANVSVATIYIYFQNKEDLIGQIYVKGKKMMGERVYEGTNPQAPLREKFEQYLRNFVAFIMENKAYYLFLEQVANSPVLRNWCFEETEQFNAPMLQWFEEAKRDGLVTCTDVMMLTMYCVLPVAQLAKEHIKGNFVFDQAKLDSAIQMGWSAITN
ncbi:TetR/AcrR family transcriptional regulator [Paenibacillus protaetiae]|nr:TetR/AcrR family transcriptional regulator [Paenibacillus protaetiae]